MSSSIAIARQFIVRTGQARRAASSIKGSGGYGRSPWLDTNTVSPEVSREVREVAP